MNPLDVIGWAFIVTGLVVWIIACQRTHVARKNRAVQAFLARNSYARTTARGRSSRFGA